MTDETHATPSEWTVGKLLGWTTEHFRRNGVDEPRLSAEILLSAAMGCQRISLYTQFDRVPDESAVATFRGHVREAAKLSPIAYLVGEKEFYSLTFEVGEGVLIPRPETETVVDRALDVCKEQAGAVEVLDFGTGSGCIVTAVAVHCDRVCGVGVDVSPAAVEVAGRNVERHGVGDRVRIAAADGLSLEDGLVPEGGFDLLLSNPPYVTNEDWAALPVGIRDYEPKGALVAGDGLAFYRIIAGQGPALLKDGGIVIVEIGAGQSGGVMTIFTDAGAFEHVGTYRGPGEHHDRVMQFVKV